MTEAAAATAVRDPLARLKDEFSSLEKSARDRLKGTSVETVATRVKAELPRAALSTVDALLDRAGLVRKTKAATVVVAPVVAPVADAQPAGAPLVDGPAVDGAPARP